MQVPVIDIAYGASDQSNSAETSISQAVDAALSEVGFMSVRNLGVPASLVDEVYAASKAFFTGPQNVKDACAYLSAAENFGYQGVAQENLDPTAPADLKETFTMRNILRQPPDDTRWPSQEFRDLMCEFFRVTLEAGYTLQRLIAQVLDVDENFFVRCHSGENVSLRLLYYPASATQQIDPGQMGAGAHTDYGLLTLLFQDRVGGLQVINQNNSWQAVPPVDESIVINSGDLLERWTNGRYKSTEHRVVRKTGDLDRLSIAMFIDPDSDTEIKALPSCVGENHPTPGPVITAGDHLQQKLEASHKDRFSS